MTSCYVCFDPYRNWNWSSSVSFSISLQDNIWPNEVCLTFLAVLRRTTLVAGERNSSSISSHVYSWVLSLSLCQSFRQRKSLFSGKSASAMLHPTGESGSCGRQVVKCFGRCDISGTADTKLEKQGKNGHHLVRVVVVGQFYQVVAGFEHLFPLFFYSWCLVEEGVAQIELHSSWWEFPC